jgi:pilus assembly protein Flp/PilA
MLKYYLKSTEALNNLRADKRGVVSFEYIIVAACVVAAVAAVFSTNTGAGIGQALQAGLDAIISKVPTT